MAHLDFRVPHSIWKSQKKSHSTLRAKRATFTFWVDAKSWLKIAKIGQFGEFLETWSLRSNSVTRQVNFNRTKIGGKCQNSKIQMLHFGWFSNNVTYLCQEMTTVQIQKFPKPYSVSWDAFYWHTHLHVSFSNCQLARNIQQTSCLH